MILEGIVLRFPLWAIQTPVNRGDGPDWKSQVTLDREIPADRRARRRESYRERLDRPDTQDTSTPVRLAGWSRDDRRYCRAPRAGRSLAPRPLPRRATGGGRPRPARRESASHRGHPRLGPEICGTQSLRPEGRGHGRPEPLTHHRCRLDPPPRVRSLRPTQPLRYRDQRRRARTSPPRRRGSLHRSEPDSDHGRLISLRQSKL